MTSYLYEKANNLKELILTYGVGYDSDTHFGTEVTLLMPILPIAGSVGIDLFDSKLLEKLGPLVFCETDDGFIDYMFYTKGRFICLKVFEFKNKDLKNKMKTSIAILKGISETFIHRPYEVDDLLLNQAYECCKLLDQRHIPIPRQIVAHYIDIDYDLSAYKYQIGDIKIHLFGKDNLPTAFMIVEPGFKPLYVAPNKNKPIGPFSPERLGENLEGATSLFEEKKSHERRKKLALAILLFFFCLMPWLPTDAGGLFVCYLVFCGFYLNT